MADRKITIALALFALVLVATDVAAEIQPNTWLFRDGRFYTNVNENILDHGSLEDPFAASWYDGNLGWNRNLSVDFSNLALGARGEHYHFRPWILSVLSTPLYFAFGLLGVLFFNCGLYALVAAATFRFVRAYTAGLSHGVTAAAVTAVAMVMASGFRHHIYNYSVDMLLVTAFLCGLWGLMEKKGWWAGALIASTVMIKPTVLLYAPALALVMWERNDGRTLVRAIYGGSVVLALYGCMNWYMFGRPWWTGYTRTLVVVNGEEDVYTNTSSFETPLEEGARDLLSGPDGVVWWHGLFILALPGMAVVLRRFPRTGIAILVSSLAAYALFSKFQWHHDRFLFPTVALLALPLALGMRWVGQKLGDAVRALAPIRGSASLVFVVSFFAIVASAFTGGPLTSRHPDEAAVQGAIALGEGHLDLREGSSDTSFDATGSDATVSLSALDAWAPRAQPLALLPLAPLARAAGRHGVVVGSALSMSALIAGLAWLLRRRLPTPLAAAVALGALLVGPMREAALGRPIETLSALLLVLALARSVHEASDARGPFVASAVLAALSGVVIEQPLLGLAGTLGVVVLARFSDARLVRPTLLAGLAVCGAGLLFSFVFWGHPLASAEHRVIVGPDAAIAAFPLSSGLDALALLGEGPSLSRAILPLILALPLAALALFSEVRLDRRLVVALAVLTGALALPGVAMRNHAITPTAIVLLVSAASFVVMALSEKIAALLALHGAGRTASVALSVGLVLLAGIGLSRRALAEREPFWIGTPRSVRAATVLLGDAPCDFLAWENMAWECAMLDGGATGRVGLALPEGPRIAGRPVRNMLLVPTGLRRSDPRVVRWEHLVAGPRLHLVVGAPDGDFTTSAMVRVRVNDTELGSFEVLRNEGGLRDYTYDTAAFAGDEVTLELEMEARARGQQAAFVVAGGFTSRP